MKLTTLKPRISTVPARLQAIQPGSWRTPAMGSAERGYGYRWQKAREQFLRENPICAACQSGGRLTAATIVDHKVPHRGDKQLFWDESNWQSLCKPHHDAKTRAGE